MRKEYQSLAQNSTKRNRPLFEYSMPLTEEEWKHLLGWVEQNYSGRTKQLFREDKNEIQ